MPVDGIWSIVSYFILLACSLQVVFGLLLFFLSPVVLIMALSRMEASIAQPSFVAMNIALVVVSSILFLGERVTARQIFGFVLLMCGIFLLGAG